MDKMHLELYHNLIKLKSGVYRGLDKTDNLVLIKSFEFNSGQSWSFQRQLEQETAILKSLSHPRIPKYLDSWQDGSIFYLVREYIEGNCLVTNKIFTEKNVISIALQLLDILVKHESGIRFQSLKTKEYYVIPGSNLSRSIIEGNENIYTKTVIELNYVYSEMLSYGGKKVDKAVFHIKREYSYDETFNQVQKTHSGIFATAVWHKLNQLKLTLDDVEWLTDHGQAISRYEGGCVLWKIYLNPSLLQTHPIVFLIDYNDLDKLVWTVPPNIFFLDDALAWRSGKRQNILIRTCRRILARRVYRYF